MRPAAQRADTLKHWLVTGTAIAAGMFMLYGLLADRGGDDFDKVTAPEGRGYYLTDAVLREMGPDGKPRVVVHTPAAEQLTSDQSVLMHDPKVDYLGGKTGDWVVTARQGKLSPDQTTLLMSGEVRVTGDASHGSPVITGDLISYDTRNGKVSSSEPVHVVFGRHVLNGRGLQADLKSGTMKLESDVNGRFVPN
jgi:LPS export ABC transporter protein LptC